MKQTVVSTQQVRHQPPNVSPPGRKTTRRLRLLPPTKSQRKRPYQHPTPLRQTNPGQDRSERRSSKSTLRISPPKSQNASSIAPSCPRATEHQKSTIHQTSQNAQLLQPRLTMPTNG